MWNSPSRLEKLVLKEDLKDPVLIISNPSNISYFTGIPSPEGSILVSMPYREKHFVLTNILEFYRFRDYSPEWLEVYGFYRSANEMVMPDDIKIIGEDPYSSISRIIGGSEEEIVCDLAGLPCNYREKFKKICNKGFIESKISEIRMVKTAEEINVITETLKTAEEAFLKTVNDITEGVSELYLAGRLGLHMRVLGGEREAFPTIVAFGENAAYPHAIPGNKKLERNELVLIDWGTVKHNYNSDSTRTLIHGENKDLQRVIEIVNEAVESAVDIVQPGIKAKEIDNAARSVLEKHGFGSKFIHGLGHGVGVDVHEEPYIRPGSNTIIEKGMLFTIEPGVYIHGRFGVRIEDMVLVTETGAKVLTRLPRIFS
ncbi:MAG: aminopeptidase P family protein [Desulfurococcales archaeon]|nr:aminopeptidase P family protein [Desulfurococcales archaeon]